jgi:apolipoprotein N-acyltransferase
MFRRLQQFGKRIKRELAVYRYVIADPRTPRIARWLLVLAVAYALSPVDLIPDFIPVLGHLDDVLILPLLVWAARACVPTAVMADCRERAFGTDLGRNFRPAYAEEMPTTQSRPKERQKAVSSAETSAKSTRLIWWQSAFALGLLGSLLWWAALPPLNLWPLAWLAPLPWLILAARPNLPGRRPYRSLYAAGFLFWMASLYWLTLPHWATSFGWIAISLYLAVYWPLFVALVRGSVHRVGIPLVIAAPIVWVGLEFARGHFLGGFTIGSLVHTQLRWIQLIQISDLAGSVMIAGLIVLVTACLVSMLPLTSRRIRWWPAAIILVALGGSLWYGSIRLGSGERRPGPTVALIQGSIDTEMKSNPNEAQRIHEQYVSLTTKALQENPNVDVVVWPETMFRAPWCTFEPDFTAPTDWSMTTEQIESWSRGNVRQLAQQLQRPILLGIDTQHHTSFAIEHYNSALLVDAQGNAGLRYDKVHRVMFGEYVPLAEYFPWLYQLTPLPGGLDAGSDPCSIEVAGVKISPSICFESTVPQLIAGQVRQLAAEGKEPDLLVNLTNDGWFWGSTELDMHLACGVFRAVECRKPFLVAANTGFSAWIDSDGRIIEQGPRRATGYIIAKPELDDRESLYVRLGDMPAGICFALTVAFGTIAFWRRPRSD